MLAEPAPGFHIEARENLRLALPLIAAQLAGVGMGAVDTVFAGKLGAPALAAVAVGVNLNTVFFVAAMGLLMACSPIIAQRRGAGGVDTVPERSEVGAGGAAAPASTVGVGAPPPAPGPALARHRVAGGSAEEIGAFLRRARRFALFVALIWFAGLNLLARPVLGGLGLAPETTRLAIEFVRALSFSSFGMSFWFVQRFSMEGMGQPRAILAGGVLGLGANALLDWLLLFGHWGAPRLGVAGCGLATAAASALMAGVLALYWRYSRRLRPYIVCAQVQAREGMRDILRLGLPIGAVLLAEAGLFVLTAMLMARFGDATVAAYQVAINFASLVFTIPVGIGQATTVRVGFAAGAREHAAARARGFAGMSLGLLNAASNAAIMTIFPDFIVGLYTEDAGIARLAVRFLWLAAAFQFFDGLQATANGALRGIKDTRVPLAVTLVAYWLVGLPVAWWLAFRTGLSADGLWWGLTAGLGAAALGLSLRFARRTHAQARTI